MARRLLQSFGSVGLLLPLSAQSATVHHGNLTRSNSAIVARIESLRSVYHLGDPIWLRLTLTNKGSDEVDVPGAPPPYALVDLSVLDSRGRPLRHGDSRHWLILFRINVIRQVLTLLPGKPVVISVYDSDNHWQRSDWANIKSWGYRISTPGSYTLIATPKIEWFGPGVAPGGESNKVRITETHGPAGGITAPTMHTCATRNATVTNAVQAQYPAIARDSGFRSATVEVEVTVGPSGNLVDARVVKSSGNLAIDEAALRAARESSYSPKLVCQNAMQGNYLFRATFKPH
jgi:TonB family protein